MTTSRTTDRHPRRSRDARPSEEHAAHPRFYTTDFAAMDRIDVSPMRAEWDAMMAEYEGDNNHDHFQRNARVRRSGRGLRAAARPSCARSSSTSWSARCTSEFSGCVLYNEIQKNVSNPDIKALMRFMARDESRHAGFINQCAEGLRPGRGPGRPEAHQGLHLLQAQVHLLRHLPVREDRLRALHHHLPPARAPPRASASTRSFAGSSAGATTNSATARASR